MYFVLFLDNFPSFMHYVEFSTEYEGVEMFYFCVL